MRALLPGFDAEPSPIISATSTAGATCVEAKGTHSASGRLGESGATWRSNSFNDATRQSGLGKLGFGGDGEVTTIDRTNAGGGTIITFYFRRAFYVPDAAGVSTLSARMIRDDGVVVYLNGAEVWRDSMPGGTPSYLTLAATIINGAGETNWLTNSLSPSALLTGWNTLAAEVHQSANTSSDVGFDFELRGVARLSDPPAVNATPGAASFTVMWPAERSYFTLHCATSLAAPVTWARITNAALLSNNQWRVTLPLATNGSRFYRLQAP